MCVKDDMENVGGKSGFPTGKLVVNLFGVPGSGKSTGAAYIFSKLKMHGVNAELITEFAKDKVWEESTEVFRNQVYIFGKQYFRMSRCIDKVDVIVTDSPLLLSKFYNQSDILGDEFDNLVVKVFHSFNNKSFLLNRVKPYNPNGRFQTESESDAMSSSMRDLLMSNRVDFLEVDGCEDGYDQIVRDVLKLLNLYGGANAGSE